MRDWVRSRSCCACLSYLCLDASFVPVFPQALSASRSLVFPEALYTILLSYVEHSISPQKNTRISLIQRSGRRSILDQAGSLPPHLLPLHRQRSSHSVIYLLSAQTAAVWLQKVLPLYSLKFFETRRLVLARCTRALLCTLQFSSLPLSLPFSLFHCVCVPCLVGGGAEAKRHHLRFCHLHQLPVTRRRVMLYTLCCM